MPQPEDDKTDHLGHRPDSLYWDWSRDEGVEVVLLVLFLVMFFAVPRTGCGIEKSEGDYPSRAISSSNQAAESDDR